jgi:hypothetical protein
VRLSRLRQRAADHHCVVARRRINERFIGEDLDVKLVLDRAARLGRRKNQARAAVKRAAEEEWGQCSCWPPLQARHATAAASSAALMAAITAASVGAPVS